MAWGPQEVVYSRLYSPPSRSFINPPKGGGVKEFIGWVYPSPGVTEVKLLDNGSKGFGCGDLPRFAVSGAEVAVEVTCEPMRCTGHGFENP